MADTGEQAVHADASRGRQPGKESLRTLLVLVVAACGLLAFIAALGDFRRQQNALAQLQWYAGTYEARMGNTTLLPLNLDPDVAPERQAKMIRTEWISPNDARILRGSSERVITTYSAPVPRALASDGRAVLFFEHGKFHVEWMDLEAFDQEMQAQQRLIDRLRQERTDVP